MVGTEWYLEHELAFFRLRVAGYKVGGSAGFSFIDHPSVTAPSLVPRKSRSGERERDGEITHFQLKTLLAFSFRSASTILPAAT